MFGVRVPGSPQHTGVAQLVEQRSPKLKVLRSIRSACAKINGDVPEWSKGDVCKTEDRVFESHRHLKWKAILAWARSSLLMKGVRKDWGSCPQFSANASMGELVDPADLGSVVVRRVRSSRTWSTNRCVAQLNRVLNYGFRGWGFESLHIYFWPGGEIGKRTGLKKHLLYL